MRRLLRRVLLFSLALAIIALAAPVDNGWAQSRSASAKAKKKPKGKKDKKTKDKKDKRKVTDGRIWILEREGGTPLLGYGKGDGKGGELIVSFACQADSKLVRVVATAGGSKGLQAGDAARIRLMSGPVRFEVAGTAFAGDAGRGLYVGGTTRITPRFFELFRRSETMTVEVQNRTTGVSLTGVGPRLETFERACLGRR